MRTWAATRGTARGRRTCGCPTTNVGRVRQSGRLRPGSARRRGQHEREAGAVHVRGGELELPSHGLHQTPRDGQADAAPREELAPLRLAPALLERVEQLRLPVRRDAPARVLDV